MDYTENNFFHVMTPSTIKSLEYEALQQFQEKM